MPAFLTHYIFGEETIRLLRIQRNNISTRNENICCDNTDSMKNKTKDKYIEEIICKYRGCYNLGLQGPDIFFYTLLGKLNSKKNIGTIMHNNDSKLFFENCLNYIYKEKIQNRDILLAYISGFIGHYKLDSSVHPYIYYYSGYYVGRKNYYYQHQEYEAELDYKMSKRYLHKLNYYIDYKQIVELKKNEITLIGKMLKYAIRKTYKIKISNLQLEYIIGTFKNKINFFKVHTGIKPVIFETIEKTIFGHIHFTPLFVRKSYKEIFTDILNERKEKWTNPWSYKIISNKSFIELFNTAKYEYTDILYELENIINLKKYVDINEKDTDSLFDLIKNKSYKTGIELEE